jgi:hypothetical protein
MRAILAIVAMAAGAAALAPAEVRAGGIVEPLYSSSSNLVGAHNDLLTGLLIALGCALFSAVLRRLPSS